MPETIQLANSRKRTQVQAIQATLYARNYWSILFPKYNSYTGFYNYEKFPDYKFKGITHDAYPMLFVPISNMQTVATPPDHMR